ncbi:MAG: tetratricopeptide repeat protein, partial [Fibrobacteria bacterium]
MLFRTLAPSGLMAFFFLAAPTLGAELHGRVIDRGTLRSDGVGKGISGVVVSLYDGKKLIGTTKTGSKGTYKIRKVAVPDFKAVYKLKGSWQPSQISRVYHLSAEDTEARDVYVDGAPLEKPSAGRNAKVGYYPGLARGFLNLSGQEAFFRESQVDSLIDISAFFDGRDSSAQYRGAMCELLWAEFLSQDRPLETRYYLAAALFPILDSLGWGKLQGMKRYLEVPPEAVREVANRMRESLRAPRKLPRPKDVRKAKVPLELASQIASSLMIEADLSERAKDKFLAQWKKSWGKEGPSFREDGEDGDEGEETVFKPNAVMEKLAVSRPESPVVRYLRGRGLFAVRDYAGASEELGLANRLRGSYPAARHLEAMAYIKLGREQEALGRFQALREAPDPFWKAKAYYGLGMLAEKEQRHSEAASNLWKAVRLYPESEGIYLLAEVSLKFTDRGELEKLLRQRADKGDYRAHYWLGRFGEQDQQTGVAEDHYRRAWDGSPAPEYAEALSRLYLSREEYGPALSLLEPIRLHLTPAGRLELAECLLQAGRSMEASKEYQAAYAAGPTPETLSRYVEALVQSNRAQDAVGIVTAFGDQNNPKVRFALAKALVGNHQPDKGRPILEELVKR